ncbi:MAG: hypothetical protein AB8B43_09745, partial [Prochlorococcus sp.]
LYWLNIDSDLRFTATSNPCGDSAGSWCGVILSPKEGRGQLVAAGQRPCSNACEVHCFKSLWVFAGGGSKPSLSTCSR